MLKVPRVPRVLKVLVLKVLMVLVLKVLVVLMVLGTPALVAAQQLAAAAYVDQPVRRVVVTIEGRPTLEPAVLDAIQLKTNAPLAMADVRETITHLFSFGRFADVQVDAEAADGGVALTFELKPIHTVTTVDFRGTLGLSESTLRDRMRERFGDTPPITRAADVASAIQQLYQERGYLAATVRAAPPIIEHDPDRATLVFDIAAGPRTTIARSSVIGQPLSPAAEIQSRLQIQPGRAYQPAALRERLDELVTSMRERRYYEASATVLEPEFSEDRTEVELTVDVQRGPLVTVQFVGDPLPKDKIDELVPVEREGSVDEDLLEDSARRIADYLRQEGYWKAEVNPPERREANGELTIVFTVNRGRIYRVGPAGVQVTGAQSLPAEELKALLRLEPGDLFVASQLGAIEGAIRQIYRTRGFAAAEISSAVNETAPGQVTPVIAVKEGPRVTIGDVAITGNQAVPVERLRAVTLLARGQPYHGGAVVRDRNALLNFYLDEGYASADVTVAPVTPVVSTAGDAARADITFRIVEGPQTIVEHIFITGNLRTRLSVIQRELQFEEGQPLGLAALTESRRRLSALGLFRRIQISAISHGDPRSQDVVIAVEEALQTTFGYGGGLQVDRLLREPPDGGAPREEVEFAPRGFFEVGRRNIGGHNRSLNLYSRLSLRPSPDPANANPFGFAEYRVIGTFRDPRALGRLGELTATAAIEQGVRTGFNFIRKGFNTELGHRLTPTIRGSVRYSFGTTRIFDIPGVEEDDPLDELTIDRVFPQVRLSAFSVAASRDTRDDPLEPQRGMFLIGDGSLAARAIGSEVGFIKSYVQGFFYKNLGKPNLVLAGGARLGLAHGFLRVVDTTDENGNPITVSVRDLPASERFFAGGETTIRGFSLDSVATPETLTSSGFPRGGNGSIVLNAELRFPVYRDVAGVAFVDGGNVFANASDLDLTRLRGSVGFGARYRSPIGPIRVDLGFKLDRRIVNKQLERPYALHFSIGQAF